MASTHGSIRSSTPQGIAYNGWSSGEWSNGYIAADARAPAEANAMFLFPFPIHEDMTLTGIGAYPATAGSAGSVFRMGLYTDNNGTPDALILDAGTIDGTSNTIQTITISQAVTQGIIWVAGVAQGSPTTEPVITCARDYGLLVTKRGTTFNPTVQRWVFKQTGVTGALPNPTTATLAVEYPYIIGLQRS